MQLQAPLFPDKTKLINAFTGVFKKDNVVYYLHNGQPVHCHAQEDRDQFKFIMALLVDAGLCQAGELSKALGVPHRNINRYYKQYKEKGAKSFFNKADRRGKCYQLTDEKKVSAQELLDTQLSNVQAAKAIGCKRMYYPLSYQERQLKE